MKKFNKWIILIVLCIIVFIFVPITLSKYTSVANDALMLSIRKPVYYIDYYHDSTLLNTQTFTYGVSQNILTNSVTVPHYEFVEWNTANDGTGTSYSENEPVINLSSTDGQRIPLYAIFRKVDFLVTFDANGGTGTMAPQTISVNGSTPLTLNSYTYSSKFFSCWNTKADGTGNEYCDGESISDISGDSGEVTLYAQWVDGVARIGSTYYPTLQSAIAAVPTDNTETTVELLANVSENLTVAQNKNIKFDFKNHTISINSGCILTNQGTVKISNGNLISDSTTDGAINNQSTGRMTFSGGRVIMTNNRGKQALYNSGGTVEITGTAYFRSESASGIAPNVRAAVQNASSGTLTISGGTIESPNFHAFKNDATSAITGGTIISQNYQGVNNTGTLTIGTLDGNPNKNSLVIQGGTEGVNSNKNYKFYDGTIKGKTNAVNSEGRITEIEATFQIAHANETIGGEVYKTIYLAPTCTVTFNGNGGTPSENSRVVESGIAIGTLPTATRVGYEFDGWFTSSSGGDQITESTIVNGDTTYFAHWTSVMIAEIDGVLYGSLAAAVNTVPTDNTLTTIKLIHDTSESTTIRQNQNIIFDLGAYTLSNNSNNAVVENNGTLEIISGTITSNGVGASAINNNATGVCKISGGRIIATDQRQAVYNRAGGYVEITGDAYLSSTCTGHPTENGVVLDRATAQNLSGGTMVITGGTINSSIQYAVSNEGTLTIGIKEDGDISITSPSLKGGSYGLKSIGTLNLYDGIMKGKTGAIDGSITDQEPNTVLTNGTETIDGVTFFTAYLEE